MSDLGGRFWSFCTTNEDYFKKEGIAFAFTVNHENMRVWNLKFCNGCLQNLLDSGFGPF